MRCENDGWFGIAPEDFDENNNILGRALGGSFIALHKLGQGGMGTVYEGRQIPLNRVVAIKVLSRLHLTDEQVLTRFEREAKSVARVVHPNVVQLIDSGIEGNDIAYIVMEYVQGVELSNLDDSEFSALFIVHVAHQVLNALSEAHAMNVIHRDLKPDNIMITSEDGDSHFVKVLDFGLASLSDGSRITVAGQALGTPWYMSPEQATASPVTEASDIYSLGCVLYEMATSKPPFPGNRPYNVMMQHVNAQVPPLVPRPGVEPSTELVQFIMKCLEKDPADRYASANDALEALHNVPEWAVDVQCDPSQSIKLSVLQLSEMGRKSSEIISEISDAIASGESPAVIRDAVASTSSGVSPLPSPSLAQVTSVSPVVATSVSPAVSSSAALSSALTPAPLAQEPALAPGAPAVSPALGPSVAPVSNTFRANSRVDEFESAPTIPSFSAYSKADIKNELKKKAEQQKENEGDDGLEFLLRGKNLKILISVGVIVMLLLILAIVLAIME